MTSRRVCEADVTVAAVPLKVTVLAFGVVLKLCSADRYLCANGTRRWRKMSHRQRSERASDLRSDVARGVVRVLNRLRRRLIRGLNQTTCVVVDVFDVISPRGTEASGGEQ